MSSEPLLVEELDAASDEDRMNMFRRYFARSRYNRLIIQQTLIKTIAKPELVSRLHVMEKAHDDELARVAAFIKATKYVS